MADDTAPAPVPEPYRPPPPVRTSRRWLWAAVPLAVLVIVLTSLLALQRWPLAGRPPAQLAPAGAVSVPPPGPGEAGLELAGSGGAVLYVQSTNAIQRIDLGSGASTVAGTPLLDRPSNLIAGDAWVMSKTVGLPTGVLVRDGGVAQLLPPAVQAAGRAYPGAPGGVWILPEQPDRDEGRTAVAVDVAGDRVGGTSIRVPGTLGVPTRHLAGSLVSTTAEGTYVVGTAGSQRLSRGALLGVGSDAVLTWDCNTKKRCDARINTPGKAPQYLPSIRKSIEGLYGDDVAAATAARGVLSPDHRWVALELPKPTRSGARLVLVELKSGHRVEVPGSLATDTGGDQAGWTPSSSHLLVLTDGRVRAFDSATEKVVTLGGTLLDLRHLTIGGTATM